MADTTERKRPQGLGRGLSALLGDMETPVAQASQNGQSGSGPQRVPISALVPNPRQPRRHFDKDALNELADSLRSQGILQPLLVRPDPSSPGRYQIIAGERRWRAAQLAQLHDAPVLVRELTDSQVLEIGLIENIQRQDLNAIDEADGYYRLIQEFGHTQDDVSRLVGKSRSHIANLMRLLDLPAPVRSLLVEGKLSAGHARAVLTSADPVQLAQLAVAKGLSVRQVETLVRAEKGGPSKPRIRAAPAKDADTTALERDLTAAVGLPVDISDAGGQGVVSIRYASLDELDWLCRRLSGPAVGF